MKRFVVASLSLVVLSGFSFSSLSCSTTTAVPTGHPADAAAAATPIARPSRALSEPTGTLFAPTAAELADEPTGAHGAHDAHDAQGTHDAHDAHDAHGADGAAAAPASSGHEGHEGHEGHGTPATPPPSTPTPPPSTPPTAPSTPPTKTAPPTPPSTSKPAKKKPVAKVYACPMHPEVTSPVPAKCPKCKMNLVEVKK